MAKVTAVPDQGELAPTRLSLLERLRDLNDQGSWQEFFDTYWKLIFCAAIKAGLSDADAEDVVQETIIGISRNMENFRYQPEVCSFKGWLMHVTRNRIIDHLRKVRSPKHSFIPLPAETVTSPPDTVTSSGMTGFDHEQLATGPADKVFEDLWDEEWKRNLFDAAMERIKKKVAPEHYQIFYLHTVKGMPARDVGELLGVGLPKVYVVGHRISRQIKREIKVLEQKGIRP